METKFSASESRVLNEMRDKLTKEFGITWIGDQITLRFSQNDKLCQVSMKIEEVDNGETEQCFMCRQEFNVNDLYKTKMTIGGCVGAGKTEHNVKLCYDCYCPK